MRSMTTAMIACTMGAGLVAGSAVMAAELQFVQHYGGNRVDVEEQAEKALTSALAYGNKDNAEAETRLRALPGYQEMFVKACPGEADVQHIVAFLEMLTGAVPANFAQVPVLPVAGYRR